MEFTDKTLTCADCGSDFIFTIGEQEFYAERGFKNEPKRCKDCRDQRRSSRQNGSRDRVMVSVVCDDCGTNTEVPFTPVNGKPVYCRDCYQRRRDSSVSASA